MTPKITFWTILVLISASLLGCGGGEPAPDNTPAVFFTQPEDGATASSPVQVEMGVRNYILEPAGEIVEGSGHLHIMVDVGCVTPGEIIPSAPDQGYYHYGQAQTETELELMPGEHTLCLQMGDGIHTALDITQEIRVTIE